MGTLWQDTKFGARMLQKSAGFTLVAVLTLALGIGANVVIFSVVNAVILRPLPFPDSKQIVLVWETDRVRKITQGTAPPADFLDWRAQNDVFQHIAAAQVWFYNLTGSGEPEQLWGARVSPDMFDMLGIKPVLGRSFLPSEEQMEHSHVVILSHALWEQHFGADPNILGRNIQIDDSLYTVVGVLPSGFSLFGTSRRFDLWMPLAFPPNEIRRDNPSLLVFARLKNGVTLAQANADMSTIAHRLELEFPDTNQGTGTNVVSLQENLGQGFRAPLFLLLGAVGLILLIACGNVANLLLSRAAGRQREVAIRSALGAGRMRLVRQLLTESLLLGLLGGGAGLLLAYGGLRILPSFLPPAGGVSELPHAQWIQINFTVLAFTFVVAILTGVLFGFVPAFHFSKAELSESLKEGGRSATGGMQNRLTRNLLVMAQVGISLVLLIGAGTLLRAFRALLDENQGFNPNNVLSMQVWLPESRYPDPSQERAFFQEAIERARALPGVESATAINFLPLTGWTDLANFEIEGRASAHPGQPFIAHYRIIDSDYFHTMQIPLLRGRFFATSEGEQSQPVAIINQTLAEQYWPNENPIGKGIRVHLQQSKAVPWRPSVGDSWITIVGIVGDVQEREWAGGKVGEIYLPYLQVPSRLMRLAVRTSGSPMLLAEPLRQVIASIDKNQPVTEIKTMEEWLSEAVSSDKMNTTLLSFFAALALILAAIGIYGVVSYSVGQRSHEIGIRMALGAQRNDILRLVVGHGLGLALAGSAIGLIVAYGATHLLSSFLFGVHSMDPLTTFSAVALMIVVALAACYIPARRATRIDPMQSLRYE